MASRPIQVSLEQEKAGDIPVHRVSSANNIVSLHGGEETVRPQARGERPSVGLTIDLASMLLRVKVRVEDQNEQQGPGRGPPQNLDSQNRG